MPLSVSAGARFDTHTMAKELAKKAALLVVEKPVELDADCKTAVVQVDIYKRYSCSTCSSLLWISI